MKAFLLHLAALCLCTAPAAVLADPDEHEHRGHKGGEYKEKFRDGPCKVERTWKRNGKYEEERECASPRHYGHRGGEYTEKFWDGNCKVERKWEKNGKYEEERECAAPRRQGHYAPSAPHDPGVVIYPPSVVIQPPPIVIR